MTTPSDGDTTLVIPTVGRPSLDVLCRELAAQRVDAPVVLVDDRAEGADLETPWPLRLTVLRTHGTGPAGARNRGWREARTRWVSFLDDDVVPQPDWWATLADDLRRADEIGAVGSTGRVQVPLPADRPPTDWERGTHGLETARWITADLSYRRDALSQVGGFDERFPRAFREDADLALRITDQVGTIVDGRRAITHPVRPADDWASLRQQAGNADDELMAALHGPDWHARAGAPVGRRRRHAAITAAAGLALGLGLAGRRRSALAAAAAWAAGTAELIAARVIPGPRDAREVRRMVLTSLAIPVAATWHRARGRWRHRHASAWRGLPDAVLLDRDDTLVADVPYNGDPDQVRPLDGAADALDRLRASGVRLAVVTNQSGVGTGRITGAQVTAVNERVEELLGPFEVFCVCPHAPDDGCDCRKPAPGLVKQALHALEVSPERAVLIGDIGSDLAAAEAAGASAILVPTDRTRPDEVAGAKQVAPSLAAAVDRILAGDW